jgi:uncharacterized protein (TIGR00255 family)
LTLNSMTGFARDSANFADWTWSWELKSVNAKGLDIRLRAPSGFDALEPTGRASLSKLFSRGNIAVGLTLKRSGADAGYKINEGYLKEMLDVAKSIQAEIPDAAPLSIDGIMALRGVIEADDDDMDEEIRVDLDKKLLNSLDIAARALVANRAEEGAQLSVVLTEFIDKLDNLLGQATDSVESQPATIRARLKDQIEQVIKDASQVDAVRLEQEIAILMTKADIREELDRLRAHIISVRELMSTGGAVGRRLDFLCQELNREANTICSKAHETALTRIGLDMKATIEQFREQVQNIE